MKIHFHFQGLSLWISTLGGHILQADSLPEKSMNLKCLARHILNSLEIFLCQYTAHTRDNKHDSPYHFLQGSSTIQSYFKVVSVSKYNFDKLTIALESRGSPVTAWGPSPVALAKGLFSVHEWASSLVRRKKKGGFEFHRTIDDYRIVLNCHFFLRHKRPIGVLVLAEGRPLCLQSSTPRLFWVLSAKKYPAHTGLCRHLTHSEFSDCIFPRRSLFII